jgi:uncharacterized delta-60 repeat protein
VKGSGKRFRKRRSSRASVALPSFVLVAALLVPAFAQAASPGDLDPSFGSGGVVTMDPSRSVDEFESVAIDARGRIVAAGWGGSPLLARYRSNGSPDPSFGEGGIVHPDLQQPASSVAIDRVGRIVVGSGTQRAPFDFVVARYHSDGTPDDSFGADGVVTTDFGGDDWASWVGIDSRGRIVAVGNRGGRRHGYGGWFVLARYTSSGALDDSFSGDGRAIFGFRGYPISAFGVRATSAAIDPKNRVLAAGSIISSDYPYDRDFALVRFSANGIRTTRSFGASGAVTTDLGAEDQANSIAIDPQGRIVTAGLTYTTVPYVDSVAIARYNPDGGLDRTFGGDGKVVSGIGTAADVATDSQGRIVAVGYTRYENQCDPNQCGPKFVVVRYLPDGRLDPAFGGDGTVVSDFGIGGRPNSVAIDSQDSIVVAGWDGGSFLLARYLGE